MPEQRVILLSPSHYSKYSLTVGELLHRKGCTICGIVITRLFNPRRFIFEYRWDSRRLFMKIWKKLILKDQDTISGTVGIYAYMKQHGIRYKRLEDFANKVESDVLYCQNYNTHTVHEFIVKKQPDVIVFTGGGLIRQPLLNISGKGVVNCHSGILPEYKGMDVVEWPILQGKKGMNGFTVHLMDRGIDTGPILKVKYLPLTDGETTIHYRERMLPVMAETLSDTTVKYLNDKITPKEQDITYRKQYYIMHDKLKKKFTHKY